jgi:DNA-binding SARP family transcriptional activator/tetratricopeptide (TPR) repeat protein/DNA-binding XRE family transcriptional regulator
VHFGEELRAGRVRARLTQRELAERAGVSVRAVRYIEQGRVARPRHDSLRRLGEVVGVRFEPEGRLAIGVLGRLEVRRGGRAVDAGTLKQRALLGLLALRPNEIVSPVEIVDGLWGERPPASWQNLVHTYASRLRKAMEPDHVISAERGGYRLAVTGDQLDLLRFRELTGAARDPRALEEALGLWRGPLLADLPAGVRDHPVAAGIAARRLGAALEYADLVLERGLPAATAVEQLRALVREEPLHEGLHARLMLALAGSGQQAAALRLFTEVRKRLDEELGVAPGAEIRAAHLQILRTEPVSLTRTVPAQLPADVTGFAGRAEHLDRLDALLRNKDRLVAITGSAGVGKTALAVRWAHRVRARFPDGQLYVNLRGYAPGEPVRPVAVLTRFLRALDVPAERVPVDEEEAANLYRTQLANRKALIVLDNAAGADQVRPLLPGSPGCLVVVTSRDRLTGLVAREGAHRLTLDVLDPGDARALLAGLLGAGRVRAEPEPVAELVRICAGLPLALRIAAANLTAAPRRTVRAHVAELRLVEDDGGAVRAAFDLSYTRLTRATRRMFRLLGLVPGPDFTDDAAAALAGCPVDDARRALRQLAAANLVQQPATGRYQFHDLLRHYAADLAHREDECPAAVDRLLGYYLRTADTATRLLYPRMLRLPAAPAPETPVLSESAAIGWLDAERLNLVAAAVHAAGQGRPSAAWRLADMLRGYFVSRGYGADGLAVCEAALRAAEQAGDAAGRASTWDVFGLIHYNLGEFRRAMACHTEALTIARTIGDAAVEAGSLHNLGRACAHLGQPERAAEFHQRALEINQRIGDRHGEAVALNYIGSAALVLGRADTARTYTNRALALSREIGDRYLEARSLNSLGLIEWAATADYAAAEGHFQDALRIAREIGFCYGEASVLIGLSRVRRSTGRPADAITFCQQALEVMRDRGIRLFEGRALAELAQAHLELGDAPTAAEHARAALDVVRHREQRLIEARALHILGLARAATGDVAEARTHWRHALEIYTGIGAPEEHTVRELLRLSGI